MSRILAKRIEEAVNGVTIWDKEHEIGIIENQIKKYLDERVTELDAEFCETKERSNALHMSDLTNPPRSLYP